MGWTTGEFPYDYQAGQDIFSIPQRQGTSCLLLGAMVFFPVVKRPGRGDNTSAPSAKFNNEQSYDFVSCITTACLLPCRVARLNQSQ
jgi:hypothetical protein